MSMKDDQQQLDWPLLQLKYEYLGYTLEQLADEEGLSLALLKYAADKWTKTDMPPLDGTSNEDLAKNLEERQIVADLVSKRFAGPKLVGLGCTLLTKTSQVAASISPDAVNAAKTLKTLTEVFRDLKSAYFPSDDADQASTPTRWEVTVVDAQAKPEHSKETEAVSDKEEAV